MRMTSEASRSISGIITAGTPEAELIIAARALAYGKIARKVAT